jgi:hypothetical protein
VDGLLPIPDGSPRRKIFNRGVDLLNQVEGSRQRQRAWLTGFARNTAACDLHLDVIASPLPRDQRQLL